MGWTVAPEVPEVLHHFGEDPSITSFVPHVPRTNPGAAAAVWAIDPRRAPLYWFPRHCPRVAVWANDDEQRAQLRDEFATEASRVQAAPLAWIDTMQHCTLFDYRFDPAPFSPWPDAEARRCEPP